MPEGLAQVWVFQKIISQGADKGLHMRRQVSNQIRAMRSVLFLENLQPQTSSSSSNRPDLRCFLDFLSDSRISGLAKISRVSKSAS